jgi:hypothetical protein
MVSIIIGCANGAARVRRKTHGISYAVSSSNEPASSNKRFDAPRLREKVDKIKEACRHMAKIPSLDGDD